MHSHPTSHPDTDVELLRFTTCGSVDDGKSSLIGRLLYDSKQLFDDQLEAIDRVTQRTGEFNLANLTDGLRAEREQGITIDVAYRYFATPKRKFIVADCPGHVQYTRNMVTGASTANLAVLLLDARKGVIEQTRRHSYLASLLGIPHLLLCINKMDLMNWDEAVFNKIQREFETFSTRLGVQDITYIPISALNGDNVVDASPHMPWYKGPTVLSFLENVHIANDRNFTDARFPVQWVVRPRDDRFHDFRGFAGQVASGIFRVGEGVIALPSGRRSVIQGISCGDQHLEVAYPPMSVVLQLRDEIDVSRGDMIVREKEVPYYETEFEAMVCWFNDAPLVPPGQQTLVASQEQLRAGAASAPPVRNKYLLKQTTNSTKVIVTGLDYRVDISTLAEDYGATGLRLNEIGKVRLKTARPVMFDPYKANRITGAFILIDEATNATLAAGMILPPPHPPPAPPGPDYVI